MNTAIIHTVSGPHPSSHRVSAPGWTSAAHVSEATGLLAQTPAATTGTWSEWASAHPVTVDASGLTLLPPNTPAPAGHARLTVRSGPESGFAIALPQGEWTLGRGTGVDVVLADPYLSRQPLALSNGPAGIRIGGEPLGPVGHAQRTHGSQPDDSARRVIGSTTVDLTAAAGAGSATEAAPPHAVGDAEPLVWPEPEPVAPVRTPSWIVYAAPIVIGIALALIVGTWWFLLLSLAGPATATLTLRTERRRFLRESARSKRAHRREIVQTLDALTAQLSAYVRGLDVAAYSALEPVPPHRSDMLVLGTGSCLSTVAVRLPRDRHARVRARRRLPPHHIDGDSAFLIAEDAPLLIDRRLPIRVSGPEARVRSVVRALVAAHLAAGSGCRADGGFPEFSELDDPVSACVVSGGPPQRSAGIADAPVCFTVRGPQAVEDAVVEVACGGPDRPDGLQVPDPQTVGEAIGRREGSFPRTAVRGLGAALNGQARIHAVSTATFLRLLATIGPRTGTGAAVLPSASEIRTTPVVDVLRQWDVAGRRGSSPLTVPIGRAVARPDPPDGRRDRALTSPTTRHRTDRLQDPLFLLDVRRSGPHALVAGTTGSGKSVLLETWLEALCRTHSPEELRLVLLDFKGGASLSRFLTHPHTDSVVTDLDEAAALRAVRSITAEITRRERHLAEAGCRDLDQLIARSHDDPLVAALPRLLVVIDEFHVLTSLSPHIVTEFEHLTAVGRSLGVHIVLATQRPSGVVSARMRANISLRICLRVRDEADSHEVLGIPDAAWIDARVPGTALVSDDAGVHALRSAVADNPQETQTPRPQITITSLLDTTEVVIPLPDGPPPAGTTAAGPPGPRHEVIAPPLPPHLTVDATLLGGDGTAARPEEACGDFTVVGLVDLPDENRIASVRLDPGSGSVTVSGGRGRGWSTAVDTLALAFQAAGLPVVHLGPHGALPFVDPQGILRMGHSQAWMVDHLIGTCETTREPVVWAIDDWDAFVNAHQTSPRVDRLERLLTGGSGMRFIVSGHRRLLAQRLAQTATTRIVFPPATDTDAVFYGLTASRFSGEWPPGRAVILGVESLTDGREGADLQIVQHAQRMDDGEDKRPHPLWTDFTGPDRSTSGPTPPGGTLSPPTSPVLPPVSPVDGIRVGVDPAGRSVTWSPLDDGIILSVLVDSSTPARDPGPPASLLRFAESLRSRGVTVVLDSTDPAQRASADAAAVAGEPVCLVSGDLVPASTGATSAALSASRPGLPPPSAVGVGARGPVLLFGEWPEPALRTAGFRGCPPIPRGARASWWVTGDTATPIRV
ncbi:FtsK/SpoIIIE domain-containing protein [Brevibacterium yomogidense]|uniref:FtsK/SpoIIIE domain-containing protein n=1 Tax=Brevibacterium yomogidense TaxID=946573 RepID=UPI0018DFB56F